MRTFVFFLFAACLQSAPAVTKVEPPNWWAGHTLNPVRVLITGSGLTGASVTASGGLTAARVLVSSSGTHLFVDVTIPPETKPGAYPLQITCPEGTAVAPFRIETPLEPTGRFQGFSPDDVIYLIMPDRFANGDPSNDDPAVSRGAFNRRNSRSYHGGDLQGIINHLPYFKELGVTALWLTPIYDNTNELYPSAFTANTTVSDYHGYGAIDYYAVDEHLGDLKLVRELVDAAHRLNIKVIQDQVANHVSPAHPWVKDSPTPTWFNGTAAHHLKETFNVWNLMDPHAAPGLVEPVLNGWFADILPDMNQLDPEAAAYEIQNALWWIGSAGFDGIRQDTLPYVPRSFWAQWSAALKRQYPQIRVVGEVLDPDPAITSFFQSGGIDTVFDYPEYFKIRDTIARGKPLQPLIQILADDRLYSDPASLVTILGDHDVPRFINEPGATVERLKLAMAFLLTSRGTPVLYYGDELGMAGADDPENRRDFPGGWTGDVHSAFDAKGRTARELGVFDFVKRLTSLRAQLEPLRRGVMTSLAEYSNAWVYSRHDDAGTVVIAINNGEKPVDVSFPVPVSANAMHDLMGSSPDPAINGGVASVRLRPVSSAIYSLR